MIKWSYIHSLLDLYHEVNVTDSTPNGGMAKAGDILVLTCCSESSRVPHLSWIGPDGPVVEKNGISLLIEQEQDNSAKGSLIFFPLHTSHAGEYTCISDVETGFSIRNATTIVSIKSMLQTILNVYNNYHHAN